MNWDILIDFNQLQNLVEASHIKPQVIFKHSTRCSISVMAKSRLERSEFPEQIQFHYLDLLQHRDISNEIAEQFDVHHQSPQILLIKNGECIFEETHSAISMDEIVEQAMREV
jgi:bacillithiol system protein YtxJ